MFYFCPGTVVYPTSLSGYPAVGRILTPPVPPFRCCLSPCSRDLFDSPGFPFSKSTKRLMLASQVPHYGLCFHCFLAYWFFFPCLSANGPTLAPWAPCYGPQFVFPFAASHTLSFPFDFASASMPFTCFPSLPCSQLPCP